MAIRRYKPTSPGRRFMSVSSFDEVTKTTPEKSLLEPVTKTLLESPLYLFNVYVTMLAMELLFPPPLWVKLDVLETSQQVPLYGELG